MYHVMVSVNTHSERGIVTDRFTIDKPNPFGPHMEMYYKIVGSIMDQVTYKFGPYAYVFALTIYYEEPTE